MNVVIRYTRDFLDVAGLVRNLSAHRELIQAMTWRDFNARYRASFGGLFWPVFQPLVMMVIYTAVFSFFLKVSFSPNSNAWTFPAYLLCGLLPWNAVSGSFSESTGVIRANANLVKRVVFPLEVLLINVTLTAMIQQIIGFILLLPLAWLTAGQLHWTLLFVPAILALQFLLSVGLNWIIASLAVYLPDLQQFISLLLMAWLFITPIFYPPDVAPPQARIIFEINPMAHLINYYRDVILAGQLPNMMGFAGAAILCLVFFMIGYFWFMHTKKGFADVL